MIVTKGEYRYVQVGGKKIGEHRHIMQEIVGRKLAKKEVVHHKDGDKGNNSPSNLEIMPLEIHSRLHMQGNIISHSQKEKLRTARLKTLTNSNTPEMVKEIKRLLKKGLTGVAIARKFNKTNGYISKIKTGYRWNWL